LKNHTTKTN